MKNYESLENYLETIYTLSKSKENIRSIDIVHELNYSKPSVSIAMKKLREQDYILMDDNSYITLTKKGLTLASKISERHDVLYDWLISLGIDEETAETDACKLEHDMSEITFQAINKYIKENS
jgi:Mn-dependent DtxR family transcriptional regulator